MTDLWVPPGLDFQATGATYAPSVVARLADGVGLAQARAAAAAYASARDGAAPAASEEDAMRLEPLGRELTRAVRPTLVFLMISVGLLLLVVCASLANVLLARVAARSHEILVRRSLGAGRWRLARQVLIESVMLTAAGGAAGLGLAAGSLKTLRTLAPAGLRDVGSLSVDARLVLIMILVSLVVAALMSVAPCLAIASREISVVRAGRGDSGARGWRGFRGGLIAAQMAMVLVLLTASAAAVGALLQVSQLHLGFGNAATVGAAVTLPLARFPAQPSIVAYADDALARLRGAPGVQRAAATGVLPGHSETGVGLALSVPGAPAAAPVYATYLAASPDYFQVMGIPVVAGRGISEADRPGAPVALVLSASTAGRLFPGGTAVGASVDLSFGRTPVRCEVVGVVADVRLTGLTANARSLQQMYVAFAQQPPFGTVSFVAEVEGGPAAGGRALTETLASVDPSIPVYGVHALDDVVRRYLSAHRTAGVFVSAFALVTLIVAAIGLYGLVAQVLAERLREMGIRLALGANPRRLRMQFVLRAVALAGYGAVGGALAAAGGLRLMASVVPGLAEVPPVMFVVNIGVLIFTAAAAAWWPSARITGIDPVAVMSDQ
jgi:putative ABC transport system permease protein